MAFGFHAGLVYTDKLCRRLSFLDRDDDSSEHYFIMDCSEGSSEVAVPNIDNVYIERDDQMWGGFGGIKQVILERDGLNLHLNPKMATIMGEHDRIRISFAVDDVVFQEMKVVLCLIMRGYESQLEFCC